MFNTKQSPWIPLPVFLKINLFKLHPILLHNTCNNLILLVIFISHNFVIVHMNKPLVEVFSKYTNHPIRLNQLILYLLTLYCHKSAMLNIHIITCLKTFVFVFIPLRWFRSEPTLINRGILYLLRHQSLLNFSSLK